MEAIKFYRKLYAIEKEARENNLFVEKRNYPHLFVIKVWCFFNKEDFLNGYLGWDIAI